MIATPHMIVGAVLGDLIQNLPLAFLAGFVSHFVFDAIPHFESTAFLPTSQRKNYPLSRRAAILEFFEVIFGATLVILFYLKVHHLSVVIAAVAAVLPDWDKFPLIGEKLKNVWGFRQFHNFHESIHIQLKPKYWIFTFPVYIIIIGIAIWAWFYK
ncbi:MAG TPA: hypothetical protein VJJ80_00115 [Patescibacteria group bacterium]|nr:hypothetical protein [Patescibacteria group bacterium]